ncbi:unnamed protein product [Fusarium equiseti]|uniref:Uncharacterized protein n=1 Tax=Fusarium equiseti TaxID=61235 RepID=A0A8J2II39_FUSEQ|nr:unnamed protein product [Fusarium equiseti]
MTKSHCFCAICGAPTGRLECDASSADTYSPHLVKPSTVEWLADIGLIIYNTKDRICTSFRLVQEMRDHIKNALKLPVEDDNTYEAYYPSNGQPVVIPLHYTCRQMLNEVPGPWPQENILYETLEPHCTVEHGFVRALDYDYGSVSYLHHKKVCSIPIAQLQNGRFWKTKKGSEYAVLSPDKIEDVDKLVGKLIELAKDLAGKVPRRSIKFLHRPVGDVNWEVLYNMFTNIEKGRAEWNMPAIPALQNRARIWKICTKIMEEYIPLLEAHRDENDVHRKSVPAQNETGNNKSPPELYEATPAAKWEHANFTYYGSLAECEPVITAHWSGGSDSVLGRLGVTISEDRDQKEKIMGPHVLPSDSPIHNGRYFRTESFTIPKGTWIREVVVYTRLTIPYEEGYSHKTKIKGLKLVLTNGQSTELGRCHGFTPEVYKAPRGHFIAGVSVDWAANRPVKRLEFYCQPISQAPPGSHARFVERVYTPPKPIPGLQAYIDVEKRPNDMLLEPESPPAMQHLTFAKRKFDLDCLTSFGVDIHLGGFELNLYPSKRIVIGPRRSTMKYLTFEGETDKDDWIIGCWVHKYNGKPVGLRFFTRKGRQLIAGEPATDGEPQLIGLDLERWAPAKRFISELSAAWSYTQSGKPQFTAFGAVLAGRLPDNCLVQNLVPSSCVDLNIADGPEKDVYLDSTSSPPCIPYIVNGLGPQTVFGRERSSDELFHRNGRRRATFCHPSKSKQLPLVAMSVDRKNRPREYRDRYGITKFKRSSFGPTVFDKEEVCECMNFPELYGPQPTDCAHYHERDWGFGGRAIQSIRIWLARDNILAGLQFVAAGEQRSPVWATDLRSKGTKFVQVNRLPSPEGMEAGLVLFLDSNESPSAYDDIVVVGIRPVGFSVDAPLKS